MRRLTTEDVHSNFRVFFKIGTLFVLRITDIFRVLALECQCSNFIRIFGKDNFFCDFFHLRFLNSTFYIFYRPIIMGPFSDFLKNNQNKDRLGKVLYMHFPHLFVE